MAQEYFHRTPTSSGNRKIFTYAGWFKKNNADGSARFDIFNAHNTGSQQEEIGFRADSLRYLSSGSSLYGFDTTNKYRDTGNWFHIVFALNTTLESERKRSVLYINGAEVDTTTSGGIGAYVAKNFDSIAFNVATKEHNVLARKYSSSGRDYVEGGAFDIFFVDGQALTPDVFGFYKDGDGYQSSGTSQATDFRPGQWSPHSPRKIKTEIERKGGFGINGFYLPMNDSSNPGADFHCAPNSIIKLKGEDLPQPRNGAPTTSDAYVSELRKEIGELGFAGCVKMDGTQRLSVADTAALDLGTGDFTIEGFYYLKDEGGYHSLFDFRGAGGNGSYPALFKDTTVDKFYYYVNGTQIDNIPMRHGEWIHVAICRSSGTTRAFVDGALAGSFSDSTNYVCRDLYIGMSDGNSHGIYGFVSNFRIVKGSALYTADFTPPTSPLKNVTNTILLCANSSTSATASTVTPSTITVAAGTTATTSELTGSIVLAVPAASTATGANLVTNGTFDSNLNGWTVEQGTVTWSNGSAYMSGGSGNSLIQDVTTVVGKRYTMSAEVSNTGNTGNNIGIELGETGNLVYVSSNTILTGSKVFNSSFTATSTSTEVKVWGGTGATGYWSNVTLKQEDAPRDYSADIKGSGTNKTPTLSGTSGIGYELGGYYGSAYTSISNNDYLEFPGSSGDFNVGTGDFTVEMWLNPNSTQSTNARLFGQTANAAGKWDVYIAATAASNQIRMMGGGETLTGGGGGAPGNLVGGQWNHFCLERHNGQLITYMNGVVVYTQSYTSSIGDSTYPFRVGQIGSTVYGGVGYGYNGEIQDFRFYKGVAKYKGGFDVPKPYTPVGIEAFRTISDTCKNNFCTWNSITNHHTTPITLTNSNLTITQGNTWRSVLGTHGVSSGKWYYEMKTVNDAYYLYLGWAGGSHKMDTYPSTNNTGAAMRIDEGKAYHDQTGTNEIVNLGATMNNNDIVGVAFDADNGRIWWSKNGSWLQGNPATGASPVFDSQIPAGETYFPIAGTYTETAHANFGQNPSFCGTVTAGTNADSNGKGLFKYAPPSGYLALCEDNLPTPAIADPGKHFKTVLWDGDGSSRGITGVGFQPDFVWVKRRDGSAVRHYLFDSVRGPLAALDSADTIAEVSSTTWLQSLDSNGFSLGTSGGLNGSGNNYVAWCWKAGGAPVTNNDGSITTQVSANRTAGFSIVKGSQTSGTTTFGHGLGKAPKMIITKQTNGTTGWYTYVKDIGYDRALRLDQDSASASFAHWVAHPTTSVFSMGSGFGSGEDYVAYCFAEIEGFSKIGVYVGNGNADGVFVNCGFKPAWVLIKNADQNGTYWTLFDSSRKSTNPANHTLNPNLSAVEETNGGNGQIDLVSNGFKCRNTDGGINGNNINYVFLAFAESPFQTSNAK